MHSFLQGAVQVPTASYPRRVGRTRMVQATAPDVKSFRAPAPAAVPTPVIPLGLPAVFSAAPRARLGPVPKLAPGRQGSGLGMHAPLGAASDVGGRWTPLESVPGTNPDYLIRDATKGKAPGGIGRGNREWVAPGTMLQPSYTADNFRPAALFYAHGRSVAPWAQSSFSRQYRPLTPQLQPRLLQGRVVPKLGIGAAQRSAGLYAFGYPTRHSVAAQIGGGPVSVLGGNSA